MMSSSATLNLSSCKVAIDLGPHKEIVLGVYYSILVLGGHVGIPLIVSSMVFAKTINHRHPTLINMLVLWFIYTTASLLL